MVIFKHSCALFSLDLTLTCEIKQDSTENSLVLRMSLISWTESNLEQLGELSVVLVEKR